MSLWCKIGFHKWGSKEKTMPYWREGVLKRMVFMRCQRKECAKMKTVEMEAYRV